MNISLVKAYGEKCSNPEWNKQFSSIGIKGYGAMFKLLNTNFRSLDTFVKSSQNFYKRTFNVPRNEWQTSVGTGQELDKHIVVRMLQGKLFSKRKDYFYPTAKGKVMCSLSSNYTDDELWIIAFMLLLDGYFDYKKDYFITETSSAMKNFLLAGFKVDEIINFAKKFIVDRPTNKIDVLSYDYTYLDSFYGDIDLLKMYKLASSKERQDLKEKVIQQYTDKDDASIIYQKLKNGGSLTVRTLWSNAVILVLLSMVVNYRNDECFNFPYDEFYQRIIEEYGLLVMNFDSIKIKAFVAKYKNIFLAIYNNLLGMEDIDNIPEDTTSKKIPNLKMIDATDVDGQNKQRQVSSILKRMAKEQTNYHCAGEDCFDCATHYFTAKESGKNYLEIHHLIPHEFGNDFENSIEILENYIPLCPHCHRLLHFGTDRERKPLLNLLFNIRKQGLKDNGLEIDIDQLEEYYHFD